MKVIEGFGLFKEIGKGQFGTVYKCIITIFY